MNLAITSLGMISSVGRDVIASCASIRANINRESEINYYRVLDAETQEIVPLAGHPIRGFTEGFNLVGRWIRMAKICMKDLIIYGGLPDNTNTKFWNTTSIIAVTPYINDDRFDSEGDNTDVMLKDTYVLPLIKALKLPIPTSQTHIVSKCHAGAITAIIDANKNLSSNGIDRIIVLAVDSYLDTFTLDWLVEDNRLKTPDKAKGLAPGEAGTCFLL